MGALSVTGGIAATVVAVFGSLSAAASAHASNFGVELNGTYRVISNGDWARTNEVYIDEQTVVQTWTVTSSCTSPIDCKGEVKSDMGWTAPLTLGGDYWIVDRNIPNWVPCANGTAADGYQYYRLWGWNAANSERNLWITDLLAGQETTKGPSGACGVNKPVDIEIPVRMEKIS